jgi:2-dehydropantoate 2-reductase
MLMKIGIVGAGSIGLLIAGYFHENGHTVTIYTRSIKQAESINQQGLVLEKSDQKTLLNVKAKVFDRQVLFEDNDFLFITVKQYNLDDVLDELKGKFNHSIVFLQNGMSHINKVKQLQFKSVMLGIVEHGAMRVSQNHVKHTGNGVIKIGMLQRDTEEINQLVNIASPSFPIEYVEDYIHILKSKLIVNSVINPLTAIFQVENGDLLANSFFNKTAKDLFNEVAEILELDKEYYWEEVKKICERTKHNYSSMNRDLFYNRRTEIDSILGYIVECANQQCKTVPVVQTTYNMVKGLEIKK